jgi:hypothetical protein
LRAKGFSLKENIQHFKTWNFLFFLFLWIIFALLDPDPESESGIRIRNPNPESRIRIRIQIHWSDWIWIRNTVFLGGIIILAQIIEKNAVVKWENLVKKSKWRLISSQC